MRWLPVRERFKRLIPQIFFNNSQDLILSLTLGLVSSFLCELGLASFFSLVLSDPALLGMSHLCADSSLQRTALPTSSSKSCSPCRL